jgi:trimeric autotransporter adhesin
LEIYNIFEFTFFQVLIFILDINMSYEISSPVEISSNGACSLSFNNSSSSQVWNMRTNSTSSQFIVDNTSLPNNFIIDSSGNVSVSSTLGLKNGGNSVSLGAATGTASYALKLPSTAPGTNQVLVFTGSNSVWSNLLSAIANTIIVQQNPSSGEFSSVLAAVNSIPNSGPNAPSDTNRYCIFVYTGVYYETATINVPSFVFIVGIDMEAVRIEPLTTGYDLFVLNQRTGLAFMTIRNVASPNVGIYFQNCGDYTSIHKIEFEACSSAMLADSSTQESLVYLEYTSSTDTLAYSLTCTDNNSGFPLTVSIENYFTFGHSDNAIIVDGPNTQLLVQSTVLQQGDGSGNGVTVENGATLSIRGIYVETFGTAINVPQDSGSPIVTISGSYFQGCTLNLNIANSNASGDFTGYSEYTKNIINPLNSFFIANQNQNIITVASKGADFTTISAALAAITTASNTNRYIISVGPGIYVESSLTLKPFVVILGDLPNAVIIVSSSPSQTLLTAVGNSALRNVTLTTGVQYPTPPVSGGVLINFSGDSQGAQFRMDSVVFDCCETFMTVTSSSGRTALFATNIAITTTANFRHGIVIEDDPVTHNQIDYGIVGLIWYPLTQNSFQDFFTISSSASTTNIFGDLSGVILLNQNLLTTITGTTIICQGPNVFNFSNSFVGGFSLVFSIPNTTVLAPLLSISTISFLNNTQEVNIQNSNTRGSIVVTGNSAKFNINPATNIVIVLTEPSGNITLSGTINQGNNIGEITNISTQIQQASSIGAISDPVITTSGLNVTINAGSGYLMNGTFPSDFLDYITYNTQTISLPANVASWLYIDDTATLQSSPSIPDYVQNIIVGRAKMGGASLEFQQDVDRSAVHVASSIDNALRNSIGNVFNSGCIGSPGSSGMQISVSNGDYWYSNDNYLPASTTNITMLGYYRNGSGGYITTNLSSVPLQWDNNSGTLQTLTSSQWTKSSIFIVGDGILQKYLFVYGQQTFATQIEATTGPLPNQPSFFDGNIAPIIGVIINGADITLDSSRITDIRPTLAFKAESATVTSDHNSLLNLTVGDAHTQYFRTDGTRVMAGNINAGNNAVINAVSVGLLDTVSLNSITVQSPSSLAAAYTLTVPPTKGNNNQILAANGDGSTQWTNTTNLGTSLATPNTLMARNGSAATHVTQLILDDGIGHNLTFAVPSLLGSYTLTYPNNVGVISQVLITSDNAGTLAWETVSSSNTASSIVSRDSSGNFSANIITANLSGNATNFTGSLLGDVTGTQGATVVSLVGGSTASAVHNTVVEVSNATSTNTPSTLVFRDSSGNFSANIITATLNGSSSGFSGSLSGDVTGTQSATVVSFVGGSTASAVNTATIAANNATSLDTFGTIVKRDSSGNFAANLITANLNGNATTANTSTNFTGSLSGDVTGTQSATVVSFVGGSTASAVNTATIAANNATNVNTASTIVKRDASGNFSAGTITANLTGTATNATNAVNAVNFTGSLSGDVTGTQSATVVSLVGGSTASAVNSATIAANNATNVNTASTIVKRDASGNFSAGTITGNLNGTATNATTAVNFTGSLSGDVTGTQSATVVSLVGGSTASAVNSATVAANNATNLNTASTIVKRDASGNFSAGTITATLNGTATNATTAVNFSGSLSGDVTGTQSATVVSLVGGSTASAVNSATVAANNATNLNTASTIVKRDASGNFSAGTITANLTGTATNATTAVNFSGSLSGDVTGTQSATVVSLVGGSTASAVNSATIASNNATNVNTASTIVKRDASGNFSAGTITANLTGTATNATTAVNFSGSLSGDVTGTQSATVVSTVGGSTASAVNTATVAANNATNLNTASTIVKRDASGNFSAGTITATLSGNATNVTGVVAVANGGTGNNTLTSNGVLVGNGTAAVSTSKAAPTGNFVGTTDTQTLTNKTLTLPIISSISNTGTLTLPTSTDTLVGRATTDTLTNKTITGTTNTVDANNLRNGSTWVVSMGGSAPTTGQVLTATSASAASWSTLPATTVETNDYIPDPIGIINNTVGSATATANFVGSVYRIFQPITFSRLAFRSVANTTGTSTMLFAIYQAAGGVSGTMSLVCSGSVLTNASGANFIISFGSTFSLTSGICCILYAQTVSTGISILAYSQATANLLNTTLVSGSYPIEFTTSLAPPQSTFNPATQGTVSTNAITAIVRLLV